jgi:hypothetical protein
MCQVDAQKVNKLNLGAVARYISNGFGIAPYKSTDHMCIGATPNLNNITSKIQKVSVPTISKEPVRKYMELNQNKHIPDTIADNTKNFRAASILNTPVV